MIPGRECFEPPTLKVRLLKLRTYPFHERYVEAAVNSTAASFFLSLLTPSVECKTSESP